MLLREIELRNWRGLDSLELGPFGDRLNLVCGPNESGKSRVFQAIRFALFESYKGSAQHKAALQSWNSAEPPFVRLVVAAAGHEYEIQKRFLKGGSALLTGGGSTLRDDEAEEALRQITRAKPAGARGISDTDMGIWPILMIRQGESIQPPSIAVNEDGLAQLHERVSAEIGLAAVSPASQKLMELARTEYERYYTGTGQENKTLRDARKKCSDLQIELDKAQAGYERQAALADRLMAAQTELTDLEQRQTALVAEANSTEQRLEKATQAANALAAAVNQFESRKNARNEAHSALQRRQELEAVVNRLADEAAQIREWIAAEVGNRERLEGEVSLAAERERTATGSLQQARSRLETFQRERRRSELERIRESVVLKIAEVENILADLEQERNRLAAMPAVNREWIQRLKTLEEKKIAAQAKLQGAAVSVSMTLKRNVDINGQARRAGEHVTFDVVEDQTFTIGDIADINVKPGGGALLQLRSAARDHAENFRTALAEAGLASLAHATEVLRLREECSQKIAGLEGNLQRVSVKSLADLKSGITGIDAELDRLGPAQPMEGDESSLTEAIRKGVRAEETARAQLGAATSTLSQCREQIGTREGELKSKDSERVTVENALKTMRSADELQQALEKVEKALGEALTERDAAQAHYDGLGGAAANDDNVRARRAVGAIQERVKSAYKEVAGLQGELRQVIESAPYESLQSAQAELSGAQNELNRLVLRAAAAERLWQRLSEARRKVVDRLTQPVISRVEPYLREIFPGCTLNAGEEFRIDGLKSPQYAEPFDELSGGAREQLALITRLGFAEVLAGDERLPLLLDDALVNTDPVRIRAIHRVLDRASEKLQIIVFTCHDILFDALGAEATFTLSARRGLVRPAASLTDREKF